MTVWRCRDTSKRLVHFTYVWNLESIREQGLFESYGRGMGMGIYCCDIKDKESVEKVIQFMVEEVKKHELAIYLECEDIEDIPVNCNIRDLIFPVAFNYNDVYLLGEGKDEYSNDIDITGYVMLEIKKIEPNELYIGKHLYDFGD